jgi:hypothetical protein
VIQGKGPWKVTKTIPGLQALKETLGIVTDQGDKDPPTLWLPAVGLVLQMNADGSITTVVNNAAPTPAVGAGFLLGVVIGNPGGGTDWSFPLSTVVTQSGVAMARAKLRGVSAQFATSATVANRGISLVVRGAGDTIAPSPSLISQYIGATAEVASNGGRLILFTPGAVAEGVDTAAIPNHVIPISSDIWLTSRVGWSIGTRTINLQAGDTWSTINVLLEAWSS